MNRNSIRSAMSGRPCGTRAKGHLTGKELISFMRKLRLKRSMTNRSRTVVSKKTGKSVHPRRTKRVKEMCANIESRLAMATANIPRTVTKKSRMARAKASPVEGYKPLYQMFRKAPKPKPRSSAQRLATLAAKLAKRARQNRMAIKNNSKGYKPLHTLFSQKKQKKRVPRAMMKKRKTTRKMSPLIAALTAAKAINYRANPRRSTRTTRNPFRR